MLNIHKLVFSQNQVFTAYIYDFCILFKITTMDLNKKFHNKYNTYYNYNNHILKYGDYGFKTKTSGVVTDVKIDLLQRFISKILKHFSKSGKTIKYWTRLDVNSTITCLSPESRMGKGKGAIKQKIVYVQPGQILFEFSGISPQQLSILLKHFNSKVSFDIKLSKRII